MTDAKPNLRSALAAAQAEVKGLVYKAGANSEQRYRFVGHEDVIGHVREAMVKYGVVVVPTGLRFVQELKWPTAAKERVAWLWEQSFEILHAQSDERACATVQVTTMPNDKASFVASTAADRTLLMRLMRLAGTSEENPEDDSHDEDHHQQSGGQRPAQTQPRAANGGNAQRPQQQPSNGSGKVVEQLLTDLGKATGDRETLANYYEHARAELAQCGANEQQKKIVWDAFGGRCKSAGLEPRAVVSGRAA